jgi:NAD(P)-dependent dehydrogenase (short-subunit alcohol dehydrogenase family)
MQPAYERVLIVGAGDGLSASLARLFNREGLTRIGLAARNVEKLAPLIEELGPSACAIACDASIAAQVDDLFAQFEVTFGAPPDVVVYNASARVRKAFVELSPDDVARSLNVSAYGGFLVAQAAAKRMLTLGKGAICFTGASASVKGYSHSAPFAMGKFALRGLAQSMARELHPKGIHVAHFVIDGAIRNPGTAEPADAADSMLDPDAIARTYLHVLRQDRSAWTWEVELRPWVEAF